MSASFNPEGKLIVSASWDKSIKIWKINNTSPPNTSSLGGPTKARLYKEPTDEEIQEIINKYRRFSQQDRDRDLSFTDRNQIPIRFVDKKANRPSNKKNNKKKNE